MGGSLTHLNIYSTIIPYSYIYCHNFIKLYVQRLLKLHCACMVLYKVCLIGTIPCTSLDHMYMLKVGV